jgi:hypothetical protein
MLILLYGQLAVQVKPVGAAGAAVDVLVPVNATVAGDPVNPVYAIFNVPVSLSTGVPVGVNTTPTVQDEVLVNVEEHDPPDLVKSEPFVPVKVIAPIVIVPPLLFVSVAFITELGVLCNWFPNATVAGDVVTLVASPVTLNAAVCGLPGALPATLNVAVCAPAACGVAVTMIVQLAFAATVEGQLFVLIEKDVGFVPVIEGVTPVSEDAVELFNVNDSVGVEAIPTYAELKVWLAGVSVTDPLAPPN